MASNGWQFSVTIPSWTQATLEGDENIVLKEELGNKKMVKLEPPSKNRLVGVNKKPDMVEKRRRELESWLWKLIGDGEIARSRVLNNFLELSDAARLVQRVAPTPLPSRPASQTGSYAWSEGGSSSMHEGSSQQSGAAPSNADFTLHNPGLDGLPSVRPGLPPLQRSASDGTPHVAPTTQGLPSATSQQSMARSASTSVGTSANTSIASTVSAHRTHAQTPHTLPVSMSHAATETQEPTMRLGLRVEQRVTVKHHVKALQQQLDRAAGDLQDAMEAIYTERHTKRQLAGQLADLQARASDSGVTQAAAREADLESSLEQANDTSAQLRQDLTDAQAATAELQSQLAASKASHAGAEQQLDAHQKTTTNLQSQLQQVSQELVQVQQAAADANAARQESDANFASTSMQLSQSQQAVSSLQSQLEQVTDQLHQLQQAAAEAETHHRESQANAAADAQKQLGASQYLVASLQSELEGVRKQLLQSEQAAAASAAATQAQQQEQPQHGSRSEQVQDLDQPTVAPPVAAPSAEQGEAPSLDATSSGQSLQALQAAADSTLAAVRAEMLVFKQQSADAEAKSRADRKVLAREVKALRKQLEEEKQQAAAKEAEHAAKESELAAARDAEQAAAGRDAEQAAADRHTEQAAAADETEPAFAAAAEPAGAASADVPSADDSSGVASEASPSAASPSGGKAPSSVAVSYRQLLQEVAALRQRLQDSSIEVVAGQNAAGYDMKPQEAMEMLSTCDGRIQALMAEANLLGDAASSHMQSSAEDVELRQAFASILIESGALRQQINTLLRDKYEAEAQVRSAQDKQTAPDVKGLFRKFTPGMPFLGPQNNGASSHVEEDATKPAFGQGIGDRFAGFGDRFSKSFSRPQQ